MDFKAPLYHYTHILDRKLLMGALFLFGQFCPDINEAKVF
jgi:hypothetical protein